MIHRCLTEDGVAAYRSTLLERIGVPHGFSTRVGGVSTPPFDSLNLGNPSGCAVQDPSESIEENYRRFERAIQLAGRSRYWVHQVHGATVLTARRGDGEFVSGQPADGILSDDPGRSLAIRVADCVPILLASGDGRLVGAVHAGWRGVVAGIVPNAINILRSLGAGDIHVAVGPCIGPDAFEVGPEVAAEFQKAFPANPPLRLLESGKAMVDLKDAVQQQCLAAGIASHRIDISDQCTCRNAGDFFSHRRDNGLTGRMAAMIGVRSG